MLFRKKIQKVCSYCANGTKIDDEQVLCVKRGVVAADGKCWRFHYDPCKRTPVKAKAVDFKKYDDEDYSL